MRSFDNKTHLGHEKAIRRGVRVPDGAVNLAWVKAPRLTPDQNIVMIDTSRIVEENAPNNTYTRKLFYANFMGILEDENGNQLIDDEYPYVSDVFSIDEDFLTTPGNEYTPESILPFVHVSRYFHVDFAGLTLGTIRQTYNDPILKVVDEDGHDYVDSEGRPRYRIQITPAFTNLPSTSENHVYRIWAFVDEIDNESLYLTYNKVELGTNGLIKNQNLNHREILNPQPYFQYMPEESDVVDPTNRREKWYTTKPATLKNQILDVPTQDADGYKVFVPKKAIGDTRLFQLFRWRVSCDFVETYKVDPVREARVIKAGVIVTNSQKKSQTPYTFLNLMRSDRNAAGIQFINPLKTSENNIVINPAEQEKADYWYVNFDTVSDDDLRKFDILIWAPVSPAFNFTTYINKINFFTSTHNGHLIFDTHNYTVPTGLFTLAFSGGVPPRDPDGVPQLTPGPSGYVKAPTIGRGPILAPGDSSDVLFDAQETLGGWKISDHTHENWDTITHFKLPDYAPGNVQEIRPTSFSPDVYPQGFWPLLQGESGAGNIRPVLMFKRTNPNATSGQIYVSTTGLAATVNYLFSHVTGKRVSMNGGDTLFNDGFHDRYVNSYAVEGAYKLFYNVCLMAVRRRTLDNSDETVYSSTWSFSTPWEASWVINADNGVLSDFEKDTNDFVYLPKDPSDPVPVWQRKLNGKTLKELIDESISVEDLRRVHNSARTYRLEITNSKVQVPTTLTDNSLPYAWTEEYTPTFTVPVELGPHIVREDLRVGDYDQGQFIHRSYPPKPYNVQVNINYNSTAEQTTSEGLTFTATGTATKTTKVTNPVRSSDTKISWATHGYNAFPASGRQFDQGVFSPFGIDTWQNNNYLTNAWGPGNLNWPFYGITAKLVGGNHGELVSFVQEALNKFMFFGIYNTGVGYLPVDGYYGSRTSTAVRNFQIARGARYIDGVVDAETWSLIGYMIQRLGFLVGNVNPNDHTRFFGWVNGRMNRLHISDLNSNTPYAKRSWVTRGPSIIWELFKINFANPYAFHGITVVPYLEGITRTLMVRSIHVGLGDINLTNYDSKWGNLVEMPWRPVDGQELYIPFGPLFGDTIIVGVGQDGPSGWGTSRMLGVRDIHAHAITQTGGGGTQRRETIPITFTGTTSVKTDRPVTIQALAQNYRGNEPLTNINWTTITTTNPNILATITPAGKITLKNNIVVTSNTVDFSVGQQLPPASGSPFSYFSMNENKVRNPARETGFISKTEGIKLLCDINGKPVGFPPMPTGVGPNEAQRHYTQLTIALNGNDPSVIVGFYDLFRRDFLLTNAGIPEMSYVEYQRRGPDNIYVAMISNYELETKTEIPVSEDAPLVPYRWAMPVYGIMTKGGSQISLEPLPKDLGPTDLWYVPIRTGRFNRSIGVRDQFSAPLTGWLKNYQGTTVRAFYGVPEADLGGWSGIYGRPNVDVKAEHPLVVDDNIIQVRQPPILMTQEPTVIPSDADPVRPVIAVWTRATPQSSWVLMPWTGIKDWNVSSGEIELVAPLDTADPNLVKVDYTTSRRVYPFKQFAGDMINLNPYPGQARDLIGKPIYIYMYPEYVKDENGRIIPDSLQTRTLRFTAEPNIFDPIRPEYDPLVVQLGVIYITTGLNIEDLVLLDSRRRGGGARDSANVEEIKRIVSEAAGYWDIGFGAGLTYQKGGFIIIRLPEELKEQFPDEREIIDVIERNITAGVRYKLETLEGQAWS